MFAALSEPIPRPPRFLEILIVTIQADEISNIIRDRIDQYNREVKIINTGTVLQVGVDIARIHGLDEVMAGELVEFEEGTRGVTLNLESTNVGVVLMGDGLMIQEGSSVKATGRIAQIPVRPIWSYIVYWLKYVKVSVPIVHEQYFGFLNVMAIFGKTQVLWDNLGAPSGLGK
ncbi:hypothetical protein OSB04_000301 [Centaurea solstitialis]|uniref:ATPase F1/V1/A1 complex alpha/beta subunit N-terminal domain-containing protein n=1 Tax=Centaurea solstitialis TaxID=347529 RepID=A0AA38WS11_9ASTR|nr:hypothetical protein OSB04_000301 [Centaurea solstitialis]